MSAKNASVYVKVHHADADTNVEIDFQHSPDGHNWVDGGSNLFSENGISSGMRASSSSTSVDVASRMRLRVKVAHNSTSSQVSCILSIWLVTKPF